MVWEGKDAVKTGRTLLGATNPLASAPGTIRGDFAIVCNPSASFSLFLVLLSLHCANVHGSLFRQQSSRSQIMRNHTC